VVTIAASGQGGSGTGSGELIKPDGYILTNNHVIAVAANGGSVQVQFSDGQTERATITGRDSLTDLAVLKVDDTHHFPVIALGSSSTVKVGEATVVLGAPLGLSGTVTSGIVSALDRTIQVPAENDKTALLVSAIQTDASINPGNSGGAINGEAATSSVQLQELTLTKKPGDQVPVEYWRSGHTTTTVTLGTQP